jgi:hypothetical protein
MPSPVTVAARVARAGGSGRPVALVLCLAALAGRRVAANIAGVSWCREK